MGKMLPPGVMARQPGQQVPPSPSNPIAAKLTALFGFNGGFRSALPRSGNPVVTAGPAIVAGPDGFYAQGNGSGKVVTDLLPSALGVAGSSPRTYVVDFWLGDTSASKCAFSLGDTSGRALSQNTLLIGWSYRTVQFQMYGTDTSFMVWPDGGTAGRVFLAIAYDGNRTLTFRAFVKVYSATTGAYIKTVYNTQTTTLPSAMSVGDTFPLNLMGGGTYNFASMDTALYFLAIFGGSVLTDSEFRSLYENKWQLYSGASPLAAPTMAALLAAAPAAGGATPTTIGAGAGTETSTGPAASLALPTTINAGTGTGTSSGPAASLALPTAVNASTGTEASTGQPAALVLPTTINAGTGTETASGQPAALVLPTTINAGTGTETDAGRAAGLVLPTAINAGTGTETSTGQGAQIPAATTINAGTGTETGSGQGASVTSGAGVAASTGTERGSGAPASVTQPATVAASTGTETDAGSAAGLVISTVIGARAGAETGAGQAVEITTVIPALPINPARLYVGGPRTRTFTGARRVRSIA